MTLARSLLLVASMAFAVAGCKQGLGDRCQTDDDCGSDSNGNPLHCSVPATATAAEGGTCTSTTTATQDLAMLPGPDLFGQVQPDLAMSVDASVNDMSAVAMPDIASGADLTQLADLTGSDATD